MLIKLHSIIVLFVVVSNFVPSVVPDFVCDVEVHECFANKTMELLLLSGIT